MYFFPIRKDGRFEAVRAYDIQHFPYHKLQSDTITGKKKIEYLQDFAAYDIESTTTTYQGEKIGFMYHWQMCIFGISVYGRTWEEWCTFIRHLQDALKLNKKRVLVIYVHNEGYEFQFMVDFLHKYFHPVKVFAAKRRQPITVKCSGLEFRCSYKESNMSLYKATLNELGCPYIKADGDLDYEIYRDYITPLSDTEFSYCMSDTLALYHYIKAKLHNEGLNIATIPLTSTGYVRNECRMACKADKEYMKVYSRCRLSKNVYTLLKEAGRGGDTSSNRYMCGELIAAVDSFDVKSSYPYQLCCKKYPITRFTKYADSVEEQELRKLVTDTPLLARVGFVGLKIKPDAVDAYLSYSKAITPGENVRIFNGRVLRADTIGFTITDVDFRLIDKYYTWDELIITSVYTSKYGYLPKVFRDKVLSYFYLKCQLDYKLNILGRSAYDSDEDYENDCYLYAKSKNKLNGIFGMCYTDPVRDEVIFDISKDKRWDVNESDISAALLDTERQTNTFLVYAWGVWTTAHAREHLGDLLSLTGRMTIYWDTDSSKCKDPDYAAISAANEKIKEHCRKMGAYVKIKEHEFYLGIYEHETSKEKYSVFKTLGAKKYAYEDSKGLHLTISGVLKSKSLNHPDGAREMASISNFHPGYTFHNAAGKEVRYNDSNIHKITINGHTFTTASNIAMSDSTYIIGETREYTAKLSMNTCKGE